MRPDLHLRVNAYHADPRHAANPNVPHLSVAVFVGEYDVKGWIGGTVVNRRTRGVFSHINQKTSHGYVHRWTEDGPVFKPVTDTNEAKRIDAHLLGITYILLSRMNCAPCAYTMEEFLDAYASV